MATQLINVTLAVADDGTVSLQGQSARESFAMESTGTTAKKKKNIIYAPVDPARDWVGGYDPAFLTDPANPDNNLIVNLPKVVQASRIAPLLDTKLPKATRDAGVLDYKGYSVVMNKDRRFAFFSAANVDGGMRPNISGRTDNWLFDDRISRSHQVGDNYYHSDKFDRGHLTRRDDMEWGSDPVDAVNRANGTCTWTNCSPQHEIFNQGKEKGVLLWQQLEKYILEQTAAFNQFKVQVITGPIFGDFDPVFREIPYPLEFWKVVAAVSSKGKLFATGYILGQKETIAKYGLEAALETPFGAFGTYQRPISLIENITGLKFTDGNGKSLSNVDPLAKPTWRPKRSVGAEPEEAFGMDGQDDALETLDDIVLQ